MFGSGAGARWTNADHSSSTARDVQSYAIATEYLTLNSVLSPLPPLPSRHTASRVKLRLLNNLIEVDHVVGRLSVIAYNWRMGLAVYTCRSKD
jgi:hypothetical protein